nr:hypothetical protein [Microbacterium azadirachtae]
MDMTEPQVWTLIGVFTAIMLGGMTLMTTLLTRAIDGRLEALEGRFHSRFDAMDSKFEGLRAEMNARFDAVDVKVLALDKDVAALADRLWHS